MAASTNDIASAFLTKASRYVERGMAEDHASEQHAYWPHFSVEPLLRATVAHVHPALLADPRSDESLLAALRVGGYEEQPMFRSRPSGALVKLLGTLDAQRFGPDFARKGQHLHRCAKRRVARCRITFRFPSRRLAR
jgi:hypothetical protein